MEKRVENEEWYTERYKNVCCILNGDDASEGENYSKN